MNGNKKMKKSLILISAALILVGCQNAAKPTPTAQTNTNTATVNTNNAAVISSHSTDALTTDLPNRTGSTESPQAKPIDVADLTADINRAEKEFKTNPKAKEDLAKAYFVRATALTGAAQYRSALGDYRKGLKLNPADAEAKEMHDQILNIFKSMKREPPKEGEEPPPLPLKN